MMNDPLPKRRRRMAPVSASVVGLIPGDILFYEILVLLPVKCLVRFQSVCKQWRATIASTRFSSRHLEHSRLRSSVVIMPRKHHEDSKFGIRGVSFYGFENGQSKVAELILEKICPKGIPMFSLPLHCDGLILIPCLFERIFVCNPATREFVEPPGSPSVAGAGDYQCEAFGFDPWSGKYKVARHFFRSYSETPQADGEGMVLEYSGAGHEVLTLSDGEDAWKWKATIDPPYAMNARTPIWLPGSSTEMPQPAMTKERGFLSKHDTLCELGGKPCYVHSAMPWDVAIWLVEDGPNLAWSLRCRISDLPMIRRFRVLACASADKDKVFLSIDGWLAPFEV